LTQFATAHARFGVSPTARVTDVESVNSRGLWIADPNRSRPRVFSHTDQEQAVEQGMRLYEREQQSVLAFLFDLDVAFTSYEALRDELRRTGVPIPERLAPPPVTIDAEVKKVK
jgi:hypothetical protein